MAAFAPESRRSHILRARHCIVVCNVLGFPDYPIWKATIPRDRTSTGVPSIARQAIFRQSSEKGLFYIDIAELRTIEVSFSFRIHFNAFFEDYTYPCRFKRLSGLSPQEYESEKRSSKPQPPNAGTQHSGIIGI
tara:strand:- start:952 stop:1353 length:402 start_codon:yes stop_codon:yes gene_type:complete